MDVSVVIVTWNSRADIERCLKSLFKHTEGLEYEIIVVDNASTDGSDTYLQTLADQKKIVFIPSKHNNGFATGNNTGLKRTRGEFILLLNPDTYIEENAISKLLSEYKKHPSLGILAPQLRNTDGTIQSSCRALPSLLDQALIVLKLHNIFKLKKYFMLDFDHASAREVGQVMGAAMFISKDVFKNVGTFDEGFKRNFEEVDLCARVQALELKVYFNPQTYVVHEKGASFKKVGLIVKQMYWNKDVLHYFRKRANKEALLLLYILQFPALLEAAIVQTLTTMRFPGLERLKKKEY